MLLPSRRPSPPQRCAGTPCNGRDSPPARAGLPFGWIWGAVPKPAARYYPSRPCGAGLKAGVVPRGLPDREEASVGGNALDGDDLAAIGLDGEHRARFDGL